MYKNHDLKDRTLEIIQSEQPEKRMKEYRTPYRNYGTQRNDNNAAALPATHRDVFRDPPPRVPETMDSTGPIHVHLRIKFNLQMRHSMSNNNKIEQE